MTKLIELKYKDALSNLACHLIINCSDISTIDLENNDDVVTDVCSAVINMQTNARRVVINFASSKTRALFLSTLSSNLTLTKSDGFFTVEF